MLSVRDIARICHQSNKIYCEALGDFSQKDWIESPDWQTESAVNGVMFHLCNPEATQAASHENWLDEKRRDGWKYGEVKDSEKKEHPCFVTYESLPDEQKAKDALFKNTVDALRDLVQF